MADDTPAPDDESPLAKRLRASMEKQRVEKREAAEQKKEQKKQTKNPEKTPPPPAPKAAPKEPPKQPDAKEPETQEADSPGAQLAAFLEKRRLERETAAKNEVQIEPKPSAPTPPPPATPTPPPTPPPPPPFAPAIPPPLSQRLDPAPSQHPLHLILGLLARLIAPVWRRVSKPVTFVAHSLLGVAAWTGVWLLTAFFCAYAFLKGFNIFDVRSWDVLERAYYSGRTIPSQYALTAVLLSILWLVGVFWAVLHGYDFFRLRRVVTTLEHACKRILKFLDKKITQQK